MESFKYTKEALRVTRATVESNYYRYILSVSMASIEISFSREVKKKKRIARGTVESDYYLNLERVYGVNCFITFPREITLWILSRG